MAKIGEYRWRQISMWDFLPENCIAKFIHSEDGKHCFEYYLQVVVEVHNDNSYRVETAIDQINVPKDILEWRIPEYSVIKDRRRTQHEGVKE